MNEIAAQIEQLQHLRSSRQTRLALDRARALLQSEPSLSAEDACQVYEIYGFCCCDYCEMRKAAAAFWQAIQLCTGESLRKEQQLFSIYVLLLQHFPEIKDEALSQRIFLYDQLYQRVQPYQHQILPGQRKLRIGYLSADFRQHVVMRFAWPFFACYDSARYEVIGYSISPVEDSVTARLKKQADGWRNLYGVPYEWIAQQIYEDQIDILVDLGGHSGNGRTLIVAGYKPAPVQICGIGWFNTTGLKVMDYFLTDCYCMGDECSPELFSERLLRMPHTHFCYQPTEAMRQHSCRHQEHSAIVFGSFNNIAKITEAVLAVWLKILQRIPGSHLLLKNTENQPRAEKLLVAKAQKMGFAANQIEVRTASTGYLDEYMEMDIALDTFPYEGGTTSCEALYMGIPLVTYIGGRHGSRFGYSLLQNLGLGELAARTEQQYIDIACTLAEDRELVCLLHKELRTIMELSPLMDGKAYMRDIEAAYEKIWAERLQQK